MARTALLLVVALAGGLAVARAVQPDPATARLVAAEVRFGDTVLLRASTSDDGKPDVDAVWGYLKKLRFTETEAFAKLRAARTAADSGEGAPGPSDSWTLRRGEEDPWIHLRIAYGGRAEMHAVTLLRDEAGKWRVADDDLDGHAALRWIQRWEADALRGRR